MALRAGRIAGRMRTRQTYRTMARMQRARGWKPAPQASEQPSYVVELERLAQLRDSGAITGDDYETKKKQILGI